MKTQLRANQIEDVEPTLPVRRARTAVRKAHGVVLDYEDPLLMVVTALRAQIAAERHRWWVVASVSSIALVVSFIAGWVARGWVG